MSAGCRSTAKDVLNLRLLTVTHFFESHGGGIERVAGHLCRHLAAGGHQVEWAASASDSPPADAEFGALALRCINPTERLTGLPMPIPGPRGFATLAGAVKRADAVIVHDALYVTSIAAMLLARLHHKPVLLVQHIAELPFTSPVMRTIMHIATTVVTKPMLRASDRVVFISDTVRRAFASARTRQPPLLLFNGVDKSLFHARLLAGEKDAFCDAHGLPASGKLVAFVGRFVAKKGLGAIREVAMLRPEITFALAGTGPIDPETWQLPNVKVLGALVPSDVGRLMRSADVLLLPSVGEGFPLVVQEALACGLPVICGEETALADPGATAWLSGIAVDQSRPMATAAAILAELDKAPLSSQRRTEMAEYAAVTYNWSAMAAGLTAALR